MKLFVVRIRLVLRFLAILLKSLDSIITNYYSSENIVKTIRRVLSHFGLPSSNDNCRTTLRPCTPSNTKS